ncbi:MAG: polymerase subunit epsilon [Bacteroidota bacterium]|nr:polymerase subunit epsilon [Bacteroidota bacterium]
MASGNIETPIAYMPYAIVDIETTGGHATGNGITDISILIHDGKSVIKRFETLINPKQKIPYYIKGLTGINDAMVANAPGFNEIAAEVFEILQGTVFVAHSVNFDYSFIKHALANCGYNLDLKKLCTVRLSRKIFPGLNSYSLGKICNYLDIVIENRHRAGGDAEATAKLFDLLLANDSSGAIEKFLKRNSKENILPPNLPKKDFEKLPDTAGVYYFHDQKGKIVYVGKANNIKKRVSSHFSNNSPSKQKQDFLRAIHGITFEECGNELMSLILESHQIKHLWPAYNRSQKRFEPVYGIVEYHDQRGFRRLGIEKMKRGTSPLIAFSNLTQGFNLIKNATEGFELCPRLTGIATDLTACEEKNCACIGAKKKDVSEYNKRVETAIEALSKNESFIIVEKGRSKDEVALILVDDGIFKRMGYMPGKQFSKEKVETERLEDLPLYRENFNIRQIISSYRNNYPENVLLIEPAAIT